MLDLVAKRLREELTRLTNQVRDLVYRLAPGVLAMCPAADEPWFWGLLQQASTHTVYACLRTAFGAMGAGSG